METKTDKELTKQFKDEIKTLEEAKTGNILIDWRMISLHENYGVFEEFLKHGSIVYSDIFKTFEAITKLDLIFKTTGKEPTESANAIKHLLELSFISEELKDIIINNIEVEYSNDTLYKNRDGIAQNYANEIKEYIDALKSL